VVEAGRLEAAAGDHRGASSRFARALELVEPFAADSKVIDHGRVYAEALVLLGRADAARPAAARPGAGGRAAARAAGRPPPRRRAVAVHGMARSPLPRPRPRPRSAAEQPGLKRAQRPSRADSNPSYNGQ